MFLFESRSAPVKEPWHIDFDRRWLQLTSKRNRIAYLYDQVDNSTFRYRIYNMVQAIGIASRDVSASWFFADETLRLHRLPDVADVLVVVRAKYTDRLNGLVSAFKERGKPVFYDVDDLVFDPRYANLLIHTLDQDLEHPGVWDFWFAYMGRIGAALQLCDRVIVTNPFLAGQVTELTGKVAAILPNFLNLEQIAVSDELLAAKEAAGYRRNRHYEIAYFSGSPSHRRDLELVTATIANVLEEFPETRFQLMGFIDVPEQLKPFAARVRYVPFSDFITLQRRIAEVELNIVPLQNNVFTNCKSELKFFEAAVVGTVTLASRTSTYKSAIESGVDGFLAAPIDWPDSIRTVLALSATQYRRMVITAAERCRMQYHPGVFGPAIIDLLLGDDAQEITDAAITAAQPA